jgi:dUTP pyrophosphatase
MIQLFFKRLTPEATLPKMGNEFAAGFDLYSCEGGVVNHGENIWVSTQIAMAIPEGYVGIIKPRSGLAFKHGVDVLAGVIDSDYRGEVKVGLTVLREDASFVFGSGERIAQIVFLPLAQFDSIAVVDELPSVIGGRGVNGFGSTGSK